MQKFTLEDFTTWLQFFIDERLDAALERHATRHPQYADDAPGEASPTYVDKRAAARLLDCSVSSIDNFRRSGKLKAHRIGRKAVRFLRADVLALADGGTPEKNR